jgi:general stress protein 26
MTMAESPVESLEMVQVRSFAQASAATLASFPVEHALSGPELDGFLSERRYAMVATTRPDGRPHATMAAFRHRDGRLWLPTVAAAARVRNISANPGITVIVAEGVGDEHVMVMLEGRAILHHDPEPIMTAWFREAWVAVYESDLSWAGRIIEVIPTKVLSYSGSSRS